MYDVFVIGGLVLDLYEEFDRYPKEGEEVFSSSFSSGIGGTAYNIARGLSYNGIRPILSGYIGDDIIGRLIEKGLRQRGIDTHLIKTKGTSTGIVFSLLTPNDRTMFTYRGADSLFSFTDEMIDIAKKSKITCISSYVFMGKDREDEIYNFFESIRGYTQIAFSIAQGVLDKKLHWVVNILTKIDTLFMNKYEYEILKDYIPHHIEKIITLGKEGARYVRGSKVFYSPQEKKIKHGKFTGAGDLFCSGFLAGKIKRLSISQSLSLGNATSLSWIKRGLK